jgi:hypothetical protein
MISESDGLDQFLRDQVPKIRQLGGVVSARDVSRHWWKFRRGGGDSLLTCMVQRGMGEWRQVKAGPKGGRPTRVFVLHESASTEPAESNPTSESILVTQ